MQDFWKKIKSHRRELSLLLKFIYSEKATKFCKISTNHLAGSIYIVGTGQIIGGDLAKFCGLFRIYEL